MQTVSGFRRGFGRIVMATLLSASLPGRPALADRIFTFAQGGTGTPPGAVSASGFLALSDAAFAEGIAITGHERAPAVDWPALGLTGLSLTVATSSAFALTAGLDDLVPASSPTSLLRWNLALASDAFGMPSGTFRFNDGESDFAFTLNGAAGFGSFNTDHPWGSPCTSTGACGFTASIQPKAVPEPASAALFGSGLAALGLLRWRRADARRRGRSPGAA